MKRYIQKEIVIAHLISGRKIYARKNTCTSKSGLTIYSAWNYWIEVDGNLLYIHHKTIESLKIKNIVDEKLNLNHPTP